MASPNRLYELIALSVTLRIRYTMVTTEMNILNTLPGDNSDADARYAVLEARRDRLERELAPIGEEFRSLMEARYGGYQAWSEDAKNLFIAFHAQANLEVDWLEIDGIEGI